MKQHLKIQSERLLVGFMCGLFFLGPIGFALFLLVNWDVESAVKMAVIGSIGIAFGFTLGSYIIDELTAP